MVRWSVSVQFQLPHSGDIRFSSEYFIVRRIPSNMFEHFSHIVAMENFRIERCRYILIDLIENMEFHLLSNTFGYMFEYRFDFLLLVFAYWHMSIRCILFTDRDTYAFFQYPQYSLNIP